MRSGTDPLLFDPVPRACINLERQCGCVTQFAAYQLIRRNGITARAPPRSSFDWRQWPLV
jgi:hypothetical protein